MLLFRSGVRRLVILALFTTLLFSRLALAFYACPALQQPATMGQMNGVNCVEAVDHSKMIDGTQPALCAQHLADEQQITTAATRPQAFEPILFLAYPLPAFAVTLAAEEAQRIAATETPPDPGDGGNALFLQTRRLRV